MVFYFTATGNSLYAARQLDCECYSIPQEMHGEMLYKAETIGIVCPICGHEMPQLVKDFIAQTSFVTDYLYLILTYGNRHGGASELAERFAQSVGKHFRYINVLLMPDKFAKSGYHAEKSAFVNAPVITEFPVALECELAEIVGTENLYAVIGKIVNVSADEKVLSENGKIDPMKLNALIFDQFQSGYYVATEKVGQAWNAGKEMMKNAQE